MKARAGKADADWWHYLDCLTGEGKRIGKGRRKCIEPISIEYFSSCTDICQFAGKFRAATYLTTASDWLINLYLMLNSKGFSSRILRGGWNTCKEMQFEMLKCQKVQSFWKCSNGNVTDGYSPCDENQLESLPNEFKIPIAVFNLDISLCLNTWQNKYFSFIAKFKRFLKLIYICTFM